MLYICVFDRNMQSHDAEQLSRLSIVESTHCQFAPNSLKMSFVANSFSGLYRHGALLSARKVLAPVHPIVSSLPPQSELRFGQE